MAQQFRVTLLTESTRNLQKKHFIRNTFSKKAPPLYFPILPTFREISFSHLGRLSTIPPPVRRSSLRRRSTPSNGRQRTDARTSTRRRRWFVWRLWAFPALSDFGLTGGESTKFWLDAEEVRFPNWKAIWGEHRKPEENNVTQLILRNVF
jgi:hypothetical protein